ncbi:zinc ribbon domain-containing protein [Brevibacillus gelatini]|nr:zinc ribbon domain-containing protein [Brevibacillus gelatini]
MKSIKPGRGQSAMGVVGSLAAVVFGIFWTILTFSITQDSPFPMVGTIFPLFGVVFVIIGIVQAVYHFKNATGEERMSLYDITDASEEGDPLNRKYGGERTAAEPTRTEAAGEKAFCPYCGQRVQADYQYCPACGKKV